MSDQQVAVHPSPPATQPSSKAASPSRPLDTHNYLIDGLENAVHKEFVDNRSFAGAVKSQMNLSRARKGGQYIVFVPVSEKQLMKIEQLRDARYKQLRFMYLNDKKVLIVKIMLSETHEVATSQFSHALRKKAATVRPGLDEDLIDIRATTFKGLLSSKEADSAFKPLSARAGKGKWPTLVVETGVSERIAKLQVDANWWLQNSSRNVNIVLLFAITEASQTILVEQWEIARVINPTTTRAPPEDTIEIPTCITSFVIPPPPDPLSSEPLVVTELLTINFAKLFARQPTEDTSEKDLVFTNLDLNQWARTLWLSTQ